MANLTFTTHDSGEVTFRNIDPIIIAKMLEAAGLVTFAKNDDRAHNEYAQFLASDIISEQDASFCDVLGIKFERFFLPTISTRALYRLV